MNGEYDARKLLKTAMGVQMNDELKYGNVQVSAGVVRSKGKYNVTSMGEDWKESFKER